MGVLYGKKPMPARIGIVLGFALVVLAVFAHVGIEWVDRRVR